MPPNHGRGLRPGAMTTALIHRSLLINDERRFVYHQVPKAACSTVTLRLWNALYASGSTTLQPVRSRLHDVTLPIWSRDYSALVDKAFFHFAFFRNPFVRILSAYLEKIAAGRPSVNRSQFYVLAGLAAERTLGFSEFLEILRDRAILRSDRHWMPQTDVSLFDYVPIGFAGRVETFEGDIATVMASIFGDLPHEKLDHLTHQTRSRDRIADCYSPPDVKTVLEVYERDFAMLGYSGSVTDVAPTGPVMLGETGALSGNPRFRAKLEAASLEPA